MRTDFPAESPDLNPIEKVWNSLKLFLKNEYRPRNKESLIAGIREFWKTRMSPNMCSKYIDELYKTIPKVLVRRGRASGD